MSLTAGIDLPSDLLFCYTTITPLVNGRVALMGWNLIEQQTLAVYETFDDAYAAQKEMRQRIEITRKLLG